MSRRSSWFGLLCGALFAFAALAQEHPGNSGESNAAVNSAAPAPAAASTHGAKPDATRRLTSAEERTMRIEGESRFRTNCGRCHQPPYKFPPRIMATAIRHMRVRAMLTDEDMRLILFYMTQ